MPGPQHKLLQLGHDNAVVNLVPTIHNQVASHGIHGIELAAGVGGTQHRLVVGAGSNRMCEAGNGRIARARSVNGGDIGRLGAERTAVMETNGAGSAHGYDDPGDIGEAGVRGERGTELVHIVGGKARAQKAVDLGQVRLDQLRLDLGLERSLERGARGIEQHLGTGVLSNARDLGVVVRLDAAGQRTRDGNDIGPLLASSANLAVKASSSSGAIVGPLSSNSVWLPA